MLAGDVELQPADPPLRCFDGEIHIENVVSLALPHGRGEGRTRAGRRYNSFVAHGRYDSKGRPDPRGDASRDDERNRDCPCAPRDRRCGARGRHLGHP